MNFLSELFANVGNVTWQHAVMWCIGGVLIYLAIAKKMEPALLLPIGFGTILVNLPLSGAVTQGEEVGVLTLLFDSGIANEPDKCHDDRAADEHKHLRRLKPGAR